MAKRKPKVPRYIKVTIGPILFRVPDYITRPEQVADAVLGEIKDGRAIEFAVLDNVTWEAASNSERWKADAVIDLGEHK